MPHMHGTYQNTSSSQLMTGLERSTKLHANEKRVYRFLVLESMKHRNHRKLYPTDQQIADALGICVRTVSRCIQRLKTHGILYVKTWLHHANQKRRNLAIKWKAVYRFLRVKRNENNPFRGVRHKDSISTFTGRTREPLEVPPVSKGAETGFRPKALEGIGLGDVLKDLLN